VCNDVYVITREIKEAKRNRLVYFVDHCIHPSIYRVHLFIRRTSFEKEEAKEKKKKRGERKEIGTNGTRKRRRE
jgi:hypothetical protein